MRLCKQGKKKSSIAFIIFFLENSSTNEGNNYLSVYFLIEIVFLDTPSSFLPGNKKACLHTLIETHLLTKKIQVRDFTACF